ncbi:cysteine desulfurase/selenocysteine lyase [Azospirillum lipoferum]|nr:MULTISPECIES: family 2A encapsulin nanocompartment cargo protein cysteine desulfurase [Azospirillum]MCP1610969.1 cysteine desulfurase/selenocysteine lyase [Azospirillum lipoferum]MDW5533897.1 family 2A encapsulin nanocompartment cargo protein cysteine desulfurase [Azospirillum sp. NL1]
MSAIITTMPESAGFPADSLTLPPSPAAGDGDFAGSPDIGLIARLANQFFQALPNGLPSAGLPSAGPPSGGLPATIGAVPPPAAVSAVQVPGPVPAAPSLPPAAPPAGPSANPAFAAAAAPNHPISPAGDGGLGAILHSLGGALSLVPPLASPLPAAVPSTPATTTPALPSGNPYFLGSGPAGATVPSSPAAIGVPGISPPTVPAAPGQLVDVGGLSVQLRADQVPDLPPQASPVFDPHAARRDFPILNQTVNGKPLIWLDNAATTQKPQAVIDRLARFYAEENSNIHRAAHALAARATDAYEDAREKVRRFVGAADTREIVFVRGATEAINLVAKAWGRQFVREGDEIVVTWLEHHANIVPWQQLCAETGARLRVVPVDDDGQIRMDDYARLLGPRTKLVSLTLVSNALGTVTPAAEMVAMARAAGIRTLVDGAQAVSHMPVNVQALGCDFFVLSGHKMFAPTGIGVLYGRLDVLEGMQPWQGGGNMIADVTFEKTVYQPAPMRFEAGTGNIADAVGLGAAIAYLDRIGMPAIAAYEHHLLEYATAGLLTVPGLRLIGTAREKAGVLSFVLDGCRTEDIGRALDREGIAVRSGHHCAQPILRRFGVESTVRPSLAFYNTCEDIDALTAALHRIRAELVRRGQRS